MHCNLQLKNTTYPIKILSCPSFHVGIYTDKHVSRNIIVVFHYEISAAEQENDEWLLKIEPISILNKFRKTQEHVILGVLFVYLGGFRPTRAFFTHIETFAIAGEGLQIFT